MSFFMSLVNLDIYESEAPMTRSWKLSKTDKIVALRLYRQGVRVVDIAAQFGLKSQNISSLAKRAGVPLRRNRRW